MEIEQTSERKMVDAETISEVASRLQRTIDKLGMGKPSPKAVTPETEDFGGLYDILVKSKALRTVTRKLFLDGHYARAVEEAYKCINNTVKAKSRLSKDGRDLMNQAFSVKNPILKLNDLKTESEIINTGEKVRPLIENALNYYGLIYQNELNSIDSLFVGEELLDLKNFSDNIIDKLQKT